jgi:uncharacterized protein
MRCSGWPAPRSKRFRASSRRTGCISYRSTPASLAPAERQRFSTVLKTYLPAKLRAEDYPALIQDGESVPTVASSVVLAVYAWPEGTDRYRRVAKFVRAFFESFDKLKAPQRHPKWQATNLAAEVPGWTRFKAAQQWLEGKRVETAAEGKRRDPAVAAFQDFLAAYRARNPKANLTEVQAQALFSEYVKWRAVQGDAGAQ